MITEAGHVSKQAEYEADFTSLSHCAWMCFEALKHNDDWPIDKSMRWMGFVQYAVINAGLTTVTAQRDLTRPLFKGK